MTIGSDTSCTTFTILGRICRVAIGPNHISLVGANLAKGANFSAPPNQPPVGTQPNNKPNHLQKLTKQRRNLKHLPSPSQLKWWDGNVVIAAIFHHTWNVLGILWVKKEIFASQTNWVWHSQNSQNRISQANVDNFRPITTNDNIILNQLIGVVFNCSVFPFVVWYLFRWFSHQWSYCCVWLVLRPLFIWYSQHR